MATATSRVQAAASSLRPTLPSIASLGWDSAKWGGQSGRKFPGILCDTVVVLLNCLYLFLLFGAKLSPGSRVLNGRTAWVPGSSPLHHLGGLLAYGGLTVLACASMELYDQRKTLRGFSLLAIAKPLVLSTVLFTTLLLPLNVNKLYWLLVIAMAVLNLAGMASWRLLHSKLTASRVSGGGHSFRRTLIIGAGDAGRRLAGYLEHHAVLGYTVKGFLDDHDSSGGLNVLGPISQFSKVVRSEFIDDVFITNNLDAGLIQYLADEAQQCGANVKLLPDIWQCATSWQCLGDLPVMVIHSEPIPRMALILKRTLDIVGASIGLLILLPLLLVIAVMIRLDSAGPAIYASWRIGKKGARFKCFKFRTMNTNADAVKDTLRALNQRVGPTFKISDDPRITRIGKWLRTYSFDELPQLLNVLRGDMSLVGPRPHPLDDYKHYELEHRLRLRVTPGLTGLWQIQARTDPSFERNMALDLEYIRNWNFRMDLRILVRTVPAVVRGDGR
jgi:exopolysaccharide biosynthesis polyprenyl glycosylphosphotransferase